METPPTQEDMTTGSIPSDGGSCSFPAIDVVSSHQADLHLIVSVGGAILLAYIVGMLLRKKSLVQNLKGMVVILFDCYGVMICANVIKKAWDKKITLKIDSIADATTWPTYYYSQKITMPEMGIDDQILIVIGAIVVGAILLSHIYHELQYAWKIQVSATSPDTR